MRLGIHLAIAAALAATGCVSGARHTAAPSGADAAAPGTPAPALPLHTESRWIMDAANQRFKLAGVNWYGGESPDLVPLGLDRNQLPEIVRLIKQMGFNSVRIPWALQLYEENPIVADQFLTANPDLSGKHALEILDAVIDEIARQGLVVVLDNHRSRGDWCCDTAHGDGLWHTAAYPESQWIADWQGMAARYQAQPAVVGADLRNEIRPQLPDAATGCSDCDTPEPAVPACSRRGATATQTPTGPPPPSAAGTRCST